MREPQIDHRCNKPLAKTHEQRAAIKAVHTAVDATLHEVIRQGGALGNIAVEARSVGVDAGLWTLLKCQRAHDHEGECDERAHRGVDYDCEDCGQREGFFVDNGWRRCKKCGYPSK